MINQTELGESGENRFISKSSWPIIILIGVFLALAIYFSFLCDDAFIAFRFARNLATGQGPVFNPGERVEGYTSFLWMILMALAIKAGGSPEIWSRIISIIFSIGTILAFFKSCDHNGGEGKYVFSLFLIFSVPFFVWSTGGLETAAFTFFIFSAMMALLKGYENKNQRALLVASLYFALAALTRPEGLFVFAIVIVYMIILMIPKRTSVNQLAVLLLPVVFIFGAYFLWRFNYYGKLLPNTFYVKAPGMSMAHLGLAYGWHYFVHSAPFIPFAMVVYRAWKSKRLILGEINLLMLLVCIAYSIYVMLVGGDFMGLYRFMMPVLPLICFLLYRFDQSASSSEVSRRKLVLPSVALAIFIAINIASAVRSQKITLAYNLDSIGVLQNYVNTWGDAGKVLSRISQPSDTIAITAAGVIPYYSRLYTIDMLGLEATDLNKYEKIENIIRPGHVMELSTKYLFAAKPQFIIAHPQIVQGYTEKYPDYLPKSLGAVLQDEYVVASIELPSFRRYFWQCWVRNDVIHRIPGNIKYYPIKGNSK